MKESYIDAGHSSTRRGGRGVADEEPEGRAVSVSGYVCEKLGGRDVTMSRCPPGQD